MPRGVKKENLPIKICIICHRTYNWRKKWEKCWDEVTTCSNSCNRQRRALKQLSSTTGLIAEEDHSESEEDSNTKSRSTTTSVMSVVMDTTTALAYVLPIELQDKVNAIRAQHDKAFHRWMPHMNFVFPFISPIHFEEYCERLQSVMMTFPEPFLVQFEGIGFFAQKQGYTFHLKPTEDTVKEMEKIFQIILMTLPELERIIPKNKRNEFHPHMTLAQCDKAHFAEMKEQLESWFVDEFQPAVSTIEATTMQFGKLSFLHRSSETADKMVEVMTIDMPGQ